MIDLTAAVVGFALLIGLMSLGLHVAFVMFAISMAGAILYLGVPATMEYGTQYWGATNNFVLVAVPLFVLLGELLVRGGFTDRMYRSLSDWLNPLQTPLWQPQSLWLIGLVLFALISLAYALHAFLLFLRKDPRLNKYYGPATVQDELEAELTAQAERAAQKEEGAKP